MKSFLISKYEEVKIFFVVDKFICDNYKQKSLLLKYIILLFSLTGGNNNDFLFGGKKYVY